VLLAQQRLDVMVTLLLCCSLLSGVQVVPPPAQDTLSPAVQQVPPPSNERDTLQLYELMAVTVTVNRTSIPIRANPGATTLVDERNLDAMTRTVAVDEALRLVPGVKVDNQADGERVHMSIRGQGILSERGLRGIKVLEDGLPLNDPSGFASDLYDVDWSDVDRVEVLRGPGASLYGGGSTAGVLNIITTPFPREGDPTTSTGEMHAGSYGFWKAAARSTGRSGDVGYALSASRAYGDGYRVHTAFNATNVRARAEWPVTERLTLTPIVAWTSFFNQNAEGLNLTWLAENRRQANPDAGVFNELQRTRRFTGGVTGRWQASPKTALDFNGYVRDTRYLEPVPSSVQHRSLAAPGATVQLTSELDQQNVTHTLGVGADVQWQRIGEYRLPNLGGAVEGTQKLSDQTIHQSGLGIFAFDRVELSPEWAALVNVRYDRITNRLTDNLAGGGVDLSGDANFDRATVRAGLTWSPSTTFSVYGNWGQGFLPPATEELANNPAALGGFNAGLEPATSQGEEVGVRGLRGHRFLYDLALFHLETRGDFDRYRVETRPLETFYRNGGNSRRFGAELYTNVNVVDPVWLQVAYTWSHFRYRESTSFYGDIRGNQLPNSPQHQLLTDLAWRARSDLTLGVGSDTYSKWYVDASNVASVDGYTLWNARVAWSFDAGGTTGEIVLQGRNLTGVKYIAFTEPDPDGNSYQPGPERELFAGVRLTLH
jgi:iron complex outermembrane receptor protein